MAMTASFWFMGISSPTGLSLIHIYLADTQPGSSGSPVLNRHWEVVALHHSGGAHPPIKATVDLQKILKGHYKFNEGIPMRAIMPKIERYLPRK